VLILEMAGIAIAILRVSSTRWDSVCSTGFSLMNATYIGNRNG